MRMITRRTRVFASGLASLLGCADTTYVAVGDAGMNASDGSSACVPGALAQGCACEPALYAKRACYDGPPATEGIGVCRAGTRACVDGKVSACVAQVLPTAENACNGLDDDCNGLIDDFPTRQDGGAPGIAHGEAYDCTTGGVGLCAYGRQQCNDAGASCAPLFTAGQIPETCNGLDDDCNGMVDDGLNNLPRCRPTAPDGGVLLGECAFGGASCVDGGVTCKQVRFAKAEECNGLDDDCDGIVDDGTAVTNCGYWGCCGANGCCCPYVFEHDGERYRYVSTVGGSATVGQFKHLREGKAIDFHPAWLRLDGRRGGSPRAKVVAADDEIVYVAEASLAVVSHPAGHEAFSGTALQWGPGDRRDETTIALPVDTMRFAESARWMGEVDVRDALCELDGRAARFDATVDNFYELDFGPVVDATCTRLLVDGYKRKVVRHLASGVAAKRPRLLVEQTDGSFALARELPTTRGDRKAAAIDLSGIEWPSGRYRMRLFTGTHEDKTAVWMLERLRLTEAAPVAVEVRHVPVSTATLRFEGAPSVTDRDNLHHGLKVADDGRGELHPDQRTFGRFTRYGDVAELVRDADARLVVMRRGDALDLSFPALGAVPEGVRRTCFLVVSLVYKPRAFLGSEPTLLSTSVEPMPYPGMAYYPPREPPRPSVDYERYLREWQTREYLPGDQRWGA